MRSTKLFSLVLALTLPACADVTEPEPGPRTTALAAASHRANGSIPLYEVDPSPVPDPEFVQKQTFWTCAAQAEGIFVDAVARILILEARALQETDPFRQAVLLAQVASLKHQAKSALLFALEQCVAQYGPPRFWAVIDENGNLVFRQFSVGAYHAYLVEKHLEKPE